MMVLVMVIHLEVRTMAARMSTSNMAADVAAVAVISTGNKKSAAYLLQGHPSMRI